MELADLPEVAADESREAFDFSSLLGILTGRWKTVTAGVLLGLGVAVAYYFTATMMYRSEMQVLVMTKNANLPTQGVEGTRELNNTAAEDLLATHMQLLKSPRIVRQALEQRELAELPSIQQALEPDQTPVSYVIEQLDVQRGGEGRAKQAHILTASLTLSSPEDAAAVLGAIVESYQDFLGETFQDVSKEALELITQAKDELEGEFSTQESAYIAFRETSPLLWQGEESLNLHQVRATQLEQALAETRIRLLAVKSRLEIVKQALADNEVSNLSDLDRLALINDHDIPRLSLMVTVEGGDAASEVFQAKQPTRSETARSEHERLVALRMQKNGLLLDLGPDHPRVQEVDNNIRVLTEFLEAERERLGTTDVRPRLDPQRLMKSYVILLENDQLDLTARQKELEAEFHREEEAAKAMSTYEIQGDLMARDMQRKQLLYDAVVERLREINFIKDYGGYITEVISPAELGDESWPDLPIVLALGGMVGLMLGSATALGLEMADQTFGSIEEVRTALNLPLLACLPDFRGEERKVKTPRGEKPQIVPAVLAYHRPKSREAEAVRGLRTSLLLKNGDGQLKVIQVTSANPGDGKSTLAANLAVSLAQSGKSVLLIDADMRRPRLGPMFAIHPQRGLATVVAEGGDPAEVTHATAVPNLWLLPCGTPPPNPAELLTQPQFRQLLDTVRAQYDYVLIDTPPLLAVSDPLAIASKADGVLLVVRITKNGRPAVVRAREMLTLSGINLLGLVVNSLGLPKRRYAYDLYYYGSNGSSQYYGDDGAAPDRESRLPSRV